MNRFGNETVEYHLPVGDELIDMNALLNKTIKLEYKGEMYCIGCGRKTNKSFFQGYCFPCLKTAPQTSPCILHPEKCEAHLGISRDMEWSKEHCLQNHIVYLAVSSGLKVGVTRRSQVPVRWIDQGAWKAIKLAQTPNRNAAGLLEVALKKHFDDKTNWRKMLTNNLTTDIDLVEKKQTAWELAPDELKDYFIDDDQVIEITYPVIAYPDKVKSIGFDKQPVIEKKLTGIKGQYLIFEDNTVLNIRKHNGYLIEFSF